MAKSRGKSNVRRGSLVSQRARNVWIALAASMTVVGGTLWLLEGGPRMPSMEGKTLPALMATGRASPNEAIFQTNEPIAKDRWKAIVIHHTGAPYASMKDLEMQARKAGLQGLGYHFVIGNGNGIEDGQTQIGYRWVNQLPGAHATGSKADWFNRNAIGIVLVGNGDRRTFTASQQQRLIQLVETLRAELKIPANQVYLHRDIAPTSSPGRLFPADFRQAIGG